MSRTVERVEGEPGADESLHHLPRTVSPSRYDLTLRTDLETGTFEGRQDVAVTIHDTVTEIVLNAVGLDIADGVLRSGDATIPVASVRLDIEMERATLVLAEPAGPGEWTLSMTWTGQLLDRLAGFYRSRFTDDDGVEQTIATTHFEATDARRCLPCWDEPDRKAVFAVTLECRDGLTALSNGPERAREALGDGWMSVRFAPTMVMSSYLLCVVIGPLEISETRTSNGVPIRIVARPGKGHLTGFALDVAVRVLDWFADYYGIPYPEAKLDNAAIPDFAQGAMENVGLVTYRETLLLIDPEESTQEDEQDVAEVIAHELAHMWFGDLVTMRWWNGIWLNEAFATFMAYRCADALFPEWRIFDTFLRDRTEAFETDQLASTRPIEYPVHSPHDAAGMFDTLTYTKGAAVLHMLEQWLGPDRFRDGIRRYLATHAHSNTETHDLWDALEAETGEPVRRIMDAWIFQRGYPAVSVERSGDAIRLTQRRYVPSEPGDSTTWPIPIAIRHAADGGVAPRLDRLLIEAEGASVNVADPAAAVVVNAGSASFVRVFYDDALRARLVEGRSGLSPGERIGLVDDTWASVVAGDAPISAFLDLATGFTGEDDPAVWALLGQGLGWCDRFVHGTAREAFRADVRRLVRPTLERLTWDRTPDESSKSSALRGDLIRIIGILGDDRESQAQARELEAEFRRGERMDGDVAAAAVDIVAANGRADDFASYRERARLAPTPQAQERYRSALARFPEAELMERLLTATLTDEFRPQDVASLLSAAQRNRDLGPLAFRFVADHWDELTGRLADGNVIYLASGARRLTAPDDVAAVQAFFAEHEIPQNRLMLEQVLERQRLYAALRARAEPELAARYGGAAAGA